MSPFFFRSLLFRRIKNRFLFFIRFFWKRKGIWLRILFCFGIGVTFVLLDKPNYDLRFQLRGTQKINPHIVLIDINQNEWINYHGRSQNFIRPLKEITAFTDSFFWNEKTWQRLLDKILENQPLAVGISFYFGEALKQNENNHHPMSEQKNLFTDERLVWSASQDSEGRTLYPPFTRNYSSGVGNNSLPLDEDGMIRRFSFSPLQVPHLAQRLAMRLKQNRSFENILVPSKSYLLNFQSHPGVYPRINFRDILTGRIPPYFLRNKIVIVGGSETDGHLYRTPVGELTRSEVIAELVDNIVNQRWIKQPTHKTIFLYLLCLLLIAIWIQFAYPQSVALVFTVGLIACTTAFSLWLFDTFSIWIPIQAVLVQLITAYIVSLSYHLTVKENINWRLEQEKIYLTEIDQMKHNFVSLFSHDLKTPIAKIQAICDRLLAQHTDISLCKDLAVLRQESAELHKYIQKILQISRVESTDFKLQKEATDINEIILQVIEQLRPLAQAKSISFETKLEPMFLLEIDGTLIREVILNLGENAIKYTSEGGLVYVSSREENNRVFVTISDTGIGIRISEQMKIFDKFVRGRHQELLDKGTGLGLYLVKYFIELHGGSIHLTSELGKGTTVEFSLPVESLEENEMLGLEGKDKQAWLI